MEVVHYGVRKQSPSSRRINPSMPQEEEMRRDRGISPWEHTERPTSVKAFLEPIFDKYISSNEVRKSPST